MTTRAEFVATARSYIGTPYHHQGRLPGVGLDCAGLVIAACWAHGLLPLSFDVTGYARTPDGQSLKAYCDEHLQEVSQDWMQPGDVLLVRWQKGPPQHMGILFTYPHGGLAMVHADSMSQRAVSELRVKFGRAMQFVAAYSVPGIEP